MGTDQDDTNREFWQQALTAPDKTFIRFRRVMRGLPSAPRCDMCFAPFGGIGGKVFGLTGFAPSRKNPRFCNGCFEKAPLGGVEADVGVLFADVRGFTALAETRPPEEMARLLNRFYRVATDVLSRSGAVIDKLVGDEVMALFVPGFVGDDCVPKMVTAAEGLLRGVGFAAGEEPWLPLGLAADYGRAFVGNVGSGEVKDFTAIGDVVNTAARLQGEARAGQMVLSERVYQAVAARYPEASPVNLELRGKSEIVAARVVDFAPPAAPA